MVYEYAEKKQEEKEEQRRINELIREERRAQKELEEELNKIKKEEQHLLNVISKLSSQISEQEMLQYQDRLEEIRDQKEQVDYRVKNTKAGYVYVISNIGCFGESVYKIGMTRRLEPMDRVRELGGASVPFHFDVHAMIFSEDAPALEASLHRAFHHRRTNANVYAMVGSRKIGETTAKSGSYTMKISKQKAGTSIVIYAKDASGNKSSSRAVKVIDKTAPPVPTVNKITSKTVTVTGKSEKGASIYIYNGSKKIGQGVVDSRGNYKVKIKAQKKGSTIKVYAQDKSGNKSKSKTTKVS